MRDVEIGEFIQLPNNFKLRKTISENDILKQTNSKLTSWICIAGAVGLFCLLLYAKNQMELEKYKKLFKVKPKNGKDKESE
jgi:hypothetical protein